MFISDFTVKRPVFATVLSLILIAFGLLSFTRLAVREYPDIDPPVVSVETGYPGAAANVVETRITQVIEDRISGVEGVRSIESVSRDGVSDITVEFVLDRDIESAVNDVRDRVSRIVDNLPEEADPPEIFKVDASSDVILWLNLASTRLNNLELTDYARRYLVDRFSVLDGVARVRVGGSRRYAMRIWLDRKAMAARGITASDVEASLREWNVELPAGRVESERKEFTVRVARSFNTAADFERLVIGRGRDGYLVRLRDIARVEVGAADERSLLRGNRISMVGIGIVRQSKANTLDVAHAVKAELKRVNTGLPEGMKLHESYDRSVFIEASIREVYKTLFITAVLVMMVLYLFLGSLRATLIPAVTVPVSLIATFILLLALDFSINLLTLLALILAIGLVVDDAIVVLENIYRRIQEGEHPLLASYRGARQVGFAVIATTLVLVSVFVPISFLRGNTGRLFSEFAFALAGAVCFSSFVALTLSPMMCSKILRREHKSRFSDYLQGRLDAFSDLYMALLERFARRPLIGGATFLVILASIPLFYGLVQKEYSPIEDRGVFFVTATGPEGAGFQTSVEMMEKVENVLMGLFESGEASRVQIRVPASFGDTNEVNSVRGIVVLRPWGERKRSIHEIKEDVNGQLAALTGYRSFAVSRSGLGGGTGQPVQFVLGGTDYEELARWRDRIMIRAEENPGLRDLDSDYKETKPQLEVAIDKNRAADLGVPVQEIGRTLETMLGFRRVTTYIDRGEEYDVILEGESRDKQTPGDIRNIYVRSRTTGELIPLSSLVSLREFADARTRNRFNRLRAITIEAGLNEGYSLGEALDYMDRISREELGTAPVIDYKGQSREFIDASGALAFTFGLSLLIVFLVLAAQFESFIHPFTIMLTVPLAIAGALGGLWIFGSSLNVYSQIGVIMLVGLAAKNGILIVEFANQLRDRGMAVEAALFSAARQRLRPILMTSASTVMGALPLVLATGAGAESRFTIGVVILTGVFFSTVLTLFLVPVFYLATVRFTGSPEAVNRELRRLEKEAA